MFESFYSVFGDRIGYNAVEFNVMQELIGHFRALHDGKTRDVRNIFGDGRFPCQVWTQQGDLLSEYLHLLCITKIYLLREA